MVVEHRLSEKVVVRVYGGYRSIGGNCVVIDDAGSGFRVMLDQGLNFQRYRRYYGGFIEPQTLRELWEAGVIPPPDAYEGVDAVFVSHMHLDHLGALSMAERAGSEVYVPSVAVLSELVKSWEWSWKGLLLPAGDVLQLARSTREWRNIVKSVPVSHSTYPSLAFLVRTSEGNILYTGDFRVGYSPLGIDTLSNLEQLAGEGVDLLVAEGTNLGSETTPLGYEHAEAVMEDILSSYSRDVLFISYHPLDVETFIFALEALSKHGYSVVLLHERYARILDVALSELNVRPGNGELYFYDVRGGSRRGFRIIEYIGNPKSCRLAEVKPSSKIAVALSYDAVNELRTLANQGVDLAGTLLVQFTSEPHGEEMHIMEAKLGAWLERFGMSSYRIRVSGHYYPHQLGEIIKAVKPKRTILVHATFKTSCEAIKKD